jgi:hypothetical protein
MLAEMNANMETNQAKLEADRKADQEYMQDMLARIGTNRETHCKALKEMQARMKDNGESDRLSCLQNGGGQKNRSGRNKSRNTIHMVEVG